MQNESNKVSVINDLLSVCNRLVKDVDTRDDPKISRIKVVFVVP